MNMENKIKYIQYLLKCPLQVVSHKNETYNGDILQIKSKINFGFPFHAHKYN